MITEDFLLYHQGVDQHKQTQIKSGLPLATAENGTNFQIGFGWEGFHYVSVDVYMNIYEYITATSYPLFSYSHGKY
jgi:hypothetical protein